MAGCENERAQMNLPIDEKPSVSEA
jgi:hypothetical protein